MSFTPTFCPCRSHESFNYSAPQLAFVRLRPGRASALPVQAVAARSRRRPSRATTVSNARAGRAGLPGVISKLTQRQFARTHTCNLPQARTAWSASATVSRVPRGAGEQPGPPACRWPVPARRAGDLRAQPPAPMTCRAGASPAAACAAVGTLPAKAAQARGAGEARQRSRPGGKRRASRASRSTGASRMLSRLVPKDRKRRRAAHGPSTAARSSCARALRRSAWCLNDTCLQETRTYSNPLFVVNHTLMLPRWSGAPGAAAARAARPRSANAQRLWIWIAWQKLRAPDPAQPRTDAGHGRRTLSAHARRRRPHRAQGLPARRRTAKGARVP